MKILIVEDQAEKAEDITAHLLEHYDENLEIQVEQSLRSGLMALISEEKPDLLILDMSMPNFDPSFDSSDDIEPKSFAGKELMKQMKIRGIHVPVVVLTQYSVFEKGSVTLQDLDVEFRVSFDSFYRGAIYYSSVSGDWKLTLRKMIGQLC